MDVKPYLGFDLVRVSPKATGSIRRENQGIGTSYVTTFLFL